MRSDADRLNDILDAIAKIKARTPDEFDAFQGDEMLQVWVIHYLQRIGEASRSISLDVGEHHPEIPWPQIVALRNILVHEYFGINLRQVWTMTRKDLPQLEEQIRQIRIEPSPDSNAGA